MPARIAKRSTVADRGVCPCRHRGSVPPGRLLVIADSPLSPLSPADRQCRRDHPVDDIAHPLYAPRAERGHRRLPLHAPEPPCAAELVHRRQSVLSREGAVDGRGPPCDPLLGAALTGERGRDGQQRGHGLDLLRRTTGSRTRPGQFLEHAVAQRVGTRTRQGRPAAHHRYTAGQGQLDHHAGPLQPARR